MHFTNSMAKFAVGVAWITVKKKCVLPLSWALETNQKITWLPLVATFPVPSTRFRERKAMGRPYFQCRRIIYAQNIV